MAKSQTDDWGWICTDPGCMYGCLTEFKKGEHEDRTGHEMREVEHDA
jgi:hypothetical protein